MQFGPKVLFRLSGFPIDDFAAHKELFAAIGHAAMSWARFETHLDAIPIHVNAAENSDDLYNPDHPVTFGPKIKLLKRWFNQHPGLKQLKDQMRRLTSGAKNLSRLRNSVLHFILEDLDGNTAQFHGIKYAGNDTFETKMTRMTIEELHKFATVVNAGNMILEDMSRVLFTKDALALLQKREPRTQRRARRRHP